MREVNLRDILGLSTSRYSVLENGDIISVYANGKIKKLSQTISKRGKGYGYVSISDSGVVRKIYVHRIVAMAFIANPENKPEVNHIDCNTLNNHFLNLEWVNHSENIKHAWDSGMMSGRIMNPVFGKNVKSSKLSEASVESIRIKYNNGNTSYRKLAKEYGVGNSAIQSIIERKTWKHI